MPLDEGERGGQPAIEIDGGDHRLDNIGEDAGVARRAGSGLGRRQPQVPPEPHLAGHARQRLAPHQLGQPPRQMAFRLVGEPPPQEVGDDQARAPGRRGIRAVRNWAAPIPRLPRRRPLPGFANALGWVSASAKNSGRANSCPISRAASSLFGAAVKSSSAAAGGQPTPRNKRL